MNKMLKAVLATAMLSTPMTIYTIPAFSGTTPVATGNGGNDGKTAVIGLAILTFIAIILGSDGGSIGLRDCSSSAGGSTDNCSGDASEN